MDCSTPESLQRLTVQSLKTELKKRKLSTSGKKDDLIQRLSQTNASGIPDKKTNTTAMSGSPKSPTSTELHHDATLKEQRRIERDERNKIVLWRKPLVTLQYFILESFVILQREKRNVLKHRKTCSTIATITLFMTLAYFTEGSHQEYVIFAKKHAFWCLYWLGLGILSSVGLGTGLHTFLLYLGPHIAQVTLAAWECGSLDFQQPPYPDEIICPEDGHQSIVNMWTIMSKVRLEAFMWGAGTAIGELPPYFMARAARLSGNEVEDEDLEKLEEIIHSDGKDIVTRIQRFVPELVERVGFFGILACASIPNPLFDLAGITCGHCLVPFWTFFGATLIGKAIIKMHIQKTFVILSFSADYVEVVLDLVGKTPFVGPYIQAPFKKAVQLQKEKLHRHSGTSAPPQEGNILAWVFEKLVTAMIIYFVLSIVNSMAQSYAKRVDESNRENIKDPKHK